MSEVLSVVGEQARALSMPEVLAVVAAIAYLLLAIRQNVWCWLFAAVSTSIYVVLFFEARLYMESVLNLFYLAMAAYGWYAWTFGGGDGDGDNDSASGTPNELPVTVWPVQRHGLAAVAIVAIAAINGFVLDRYTAAEFPYVDSATTWAAIWATFLIARKVLENWWYWLVIDIASILIYWQRDLQLTSLLFVAYVVMIPFGYLSWRRSMIVATP